MQPPTSPNGNGTDIGSQDISSIIAGEGERKLYVEPNSSSDYGQNRAVRAVRAVTGFTTSVENVPDSTNDQNSLFDYANAQHNAAQEVDRIKETINEAKALVAPKAGRRQLNDPMKGALLKYVQSREGISGFNSSSATHQTPRR
jgi:hypothetical protein